MNGYACPGCGQIFASARGLAIHEGQIGWMKDHGNATEEQIARNKQRGWMRVYRRERTGKVATQGAA